MSDEIKNLLEKQGRDFEVFKEVNDKRLASIESGKGTADFEAQLAKINAEFDSSKKAMDEAMVKMNRPQKGDDVDPAKAEHTKAFSKFMRKGDDNGLREIEQKAYSIGVAADGGFALPEEIDRAILNRLVDISPVRQIANVV